jgi:Icc-related predicted phosphoesterase
MTASKETRIWFVTDVRGSSDVFCKILNVVRHRADVAKKPDFVLLSGNLTGGELCVIGVDRDGTNYAEFRRERLVFGSAGQRDQWAAVIEKTLGGYVIKEEDVYTHSDDWLDSLRIKRLCTWLDLFTRTDARRECARFLVVPGPHDPPNIENILASVQGIEVCDDRAVELNSELTLVCSSALTYPEAFETSRQPRHYHKSQAQYVAHIESLMSGPGNSRTKWILNLHLPPKNTVLDLCPLGDEGEMLITGPNGPEMRHIGSEAVRTCIERFKPVASLHSFPPFDYRTQKIGETRLLAPGTEAYAGYVVGAWLRFQGGQLIASDQTKEHILPDRWDAFLAASEKAVAIAIKKPLDLIEEFRQPVETMWAQKSPPKTS